MSAEIVRAMDGLIPAGAGSTRATLALGTAELGSSPQARGAPPLPGR